MLSADGDARSGYTALPRADGVVPTVITDPSSSTKTATSSNMTWSASRIFNVTDSEVERPEKKRLAVLRLMPIDLARLSMLSRSPSTWRATRARRHRRRSRAYGIPRYRTMACLGGSARLAHIGSAPGLPGDAHDRHRHLAARG